MTAGHILSHFALGRKVNADFNRKHRKWPLGMPVLVKTPAGYLRGRIFKHWRIDENEHGASVEFPGIVDMGDANGARYCHEIPFRCMKPVKVSELSDSLFKRLKSRAEFNSHGECYQAAARALGLPRLVAEFGRINREHARLGYLPEPLYSKRYELYTKLLTEARLRLSEAQYNTLYMCF
jgi:hypothetical protein